MTSSQEDYLKSPVPGVQTYLPYTSIPGGLATSLSLLSVNNNPPDTIRLNRFWKQQKTRVGFRSREGGGRERRERERERERERARETQR